jgi:hypothetical protein
MLEQLPSALEDESEPLPLGQWFDDLTWSPSQCYYHLQHNGADYILYLRWRWTNPWQAHVVKNAVSLDAMNEGEVVWSGDVFELREAYYDETELELAKEKIISLFYEFDGEFPELRLILEEYDDENSRRDFDGSFCFSLVNR